MDAEHAALQNRLVFPFATRICTSTAFWTDIGPKQVRYDGYQELAYLHPDRFDPDPSVLEDIGVDPEDTLVVLRAVGWNAAHDINAGGFDGLEEVIESLETTGATVIVSSEVTLPEHLQHYQFAIEPQRMHDLLACADLFVGESATMATESAVLGTPAIYVSTLEVGYTSDIAERYGLIFNYSGDDRQQRGIAQATAILNGEYEADWDARWRDLIAESRDTTDVILDQIRSMVDVPKRRVVQ
jgi:predicted glycosyltransferase